MKEIKGRLIKLEKDRKWEKRRQWKDRINRKGIWK